MSSKWNEMKVGFAVRAVTRVVLVSTVFISTSSWVGTSIAYARAEYPVYAEACASVSYDVGSGRVTHHQSSSDYVGSSALAVKPDVGILDVSFRHEGTSLEIDGLLYNFGSVPAGSLTIRQTEFAADGSVLREWEWLGSSATDVDAFTLYPGDVCGFGHHLHLEDDVASVEIEAVASYSERMPIFLPTEGGPTVWGSAGRTYEFAIQDASAHAARCRYITLVEYSKSTNRVIDVIARYDCTILESGESTTVTLVAPTDHASNDIGWAAWSEMQRTYVETITTTFARIGGDDRYETAVLASQDAFAADSVECVVIASGKSFADALSASALAGELDSPVLLVKPETAPSVVLAEIERLGASGAMIVGGEVAVSEAVMQQLTSRLGTGTVERIAGRTRYVTSAQVCRIVSEMRGEPLSEAFVARGDTFPDAMAASPYACSQGMPVLLVKPTSASEAVLSAAEDAGISHAYVLGGSAAVSDSVADSFGIEWTRIEGRDRYVTAANLVVTAGSLGWTDLDKIGLGVGTAYPDALSAGPCLGASDGALLLTRGGLLSWSPGEVLMAHADHVGSFTTYGGTMAVSELTEHIAHDLCF